jgi:hypothetical protein
VNRRGTKLGTSGANPVPIPGFCSFAEMLSD